jgi:hypothetical protein
VFTCTIRNVDRIVRSTKMRWLDHIADIGKRYMNSNSIKGGEFVDYFSEPRFLKQGSLKVQGRQGQALSRKYHVQADSGAHLISTSDSIVF